MRMSRQLRMRRPKYVIAQVIVVPGEQEEPEQEERHDSWTDSSHERAPQYDYDAVIPISRQRIGFQPNTLGAR